MNLKHFCSNRKREINCLKRCSLFELPFLCHCTFFTVSTDERTAFVKTLHNYFKFTTERDENFHGEKCGNLIKAFASVQYKRKVSFKFQFTCFSTMTGILVLIVFLNSIALPGECVNYRRMIKPNTPENSKNSK